MDSLGAEARRTPRRNKYLRGRVQYKEADRAYGHCIGGRACKGAKKENKPDTPLSSSGDKTMLASAQNSGKPSGFQSVAPMEVDPISEKLKLVPELFASALQRSQFSDLIRARSLLRETLRQRRWIDLEKPLTEAPNGL